MYSTNENRIQFVEKNAWKPYWKARYFEIKLKKLERSVHIKMRPMV
jgi:hypothetical protein